MIYDLLVTAEKEHGLNTLTDTYDQVFLEADKVQEVWQNPFLELKASQKLETSVEVDSPKSFHSPSNKSSLPQMAIPKGIYQESKMLGSGKNHNLNVSAIKEKSAYVSMFKSMGDGLGEPDSQP